MESYEVIWSHMKLTIFGVHLLVHSNAILSGGLQIVETTEYETILSTQSRCRRLIYDLIVAMSLYSVSLLHINASYLHALRIVL